MAALTSEGRDRSTRTHREHLAQKHRAFGGLLAGNRLADVLLRGGFGREKRLLAVQRTSRQLQYFGRGDQRGLHLQQAGVSMVKSV
jgi:hypothetical protein